MAAPADMVEAVLKAEESSLPFATVFVAPPDFSLDESAAKQLNGLIGAHVVSDSQTSKVILIWKSAAHAQASDGRLRTLFQVGNAEWSGLVARTIVPQKPLWKRISLGKAILAAAAMFGALAAMRDYYAELFVSPRVGVDLSATAPLDYAGGAQLRIPFSVRNLVRFGRANIEFGRPTLTSAAGGQPTLLSVDRTAVPQLTPGSSADAVVWGEAPQVRGASPPAPYELKIVGTASIGLFARSVPIEAKRTIQVWADRGWKYKLIQRGQSLSVLRVTLYPGRDFETGWTGALSFRTTAPIEDISVEGVTGRHKCVSAAGGYLCSVEVTTPALKALTERSFHMTITAESPQTDRFWTELEQNIKARF